MKIKFLDEKGNDLNFWLGQEWNHIPRMEDLIQFNDFEYEIVDIKWESPMWVKIWLKPHALVSEPTFA